MAKSKQSLWRRLTNNVLSMEETAGLVLGVIAIAAIAFWLGTQAG